MIPASIANDPRVKDLVSRLPEAKGAWHVSGLGGSSAPMVVSLAATTLPADRAILYLTAHLEQADDAHDDVEFFSQRPWTLFPAWETLPGEGAAGGEIEAERLRVCTELLNRGAIPATNKAVTFEGSHRRKRRNGHIPGGNPHPSGLAKRDDGFAPCLVAPFLALMQPVPTPEQLEEGSLRIRVGAQNGRSPAASPDTLLTWAVDRGFIRLDLVESPGDVARRGDIVDLFVPGESTPYRIQFDGEAVESIRRFDISTQRSVESLNSLAITASRKEWKPDTDTCADLLAYLPTDALIVLDEPGEIQSLGETLEKRLADSRRLFSTRDLLSRIGAFPQLQLSVFGTAAAADEERFDLGVTSVSRFEGDAADAVAELGRLSTEQELHLVCDTDGERQRLCEMLRERSPDAVDRIHTHIGIMHRGFAWTRCHTLVIPHHEIFHRHRQRRRIRRVHAGRPIESWLDLKPGEYVVHVVHGIAVYRGLKKMRKGTSNQEEEFLALEFADQAAIYVPCSQVDLVQKYIGAGGRKPELSKLGGNRWANTKQRVADAVSDLAESLLRLQALRDAASGTAYPADTQWQREFEAAFPYDETEDQLTVAVEIRDDLIRPRPMDRLICGDVGYGKTELAMRAAFKVVEYGRQAAVLVPTTVLAEQHYETFRERMAEYPFVIAGLSRFRSAADQRRIVEDLKKGRIDIVIGTHRLLSKDVTFADLGLVIIDEEQRFGVEHKEKLKAMRETVDVLTLTATPIPRTLHMSLMGIRDISSLQTPPVDRRAIATQVLPFSRSQIRDAVLRELNRDGQIFFVHNYVQSIAAMAQTVKTIVPEARVVYGHGQMKDDELERVMHRFVRKEADVLVCTTIIESGIDIPSANTIFINRADRFGLADLHQLRGRVGRSDHRGYCYLLLSPDRPPTSKAAKRLKTVEEFSELGAGFRIAMRDLEIRGAGNLLGKEQSGHIAAVGYEMYCRLVEQTVRRLKNEPDPTPPPVHVDLDVAAHIPRHYIASERSRIEIYRRITTCRTEEDLRQLERDLNDAFGPFPKEVDRLLLVAEIRVFARRFGVESISLQPPDVIFAIQHVQRAEAVFVDAAGSVRMPDSRTVYWRPPSSYLQPDTLVPILRRMLLRASTQE